jgi:hypothetical protein
VAEERRIVFIRVSGTKGDMRGWGGMHGSRGVEGQPPSIYQVDRE